MARPGGPTPEVTDRIVAHIDGGANQRAAFAAAGVLPKTAETWVSRGRRAIAQDDPQPADEAYIVFVEAVDAAVGRVRSRMANVVVNAATGDDPDWRAAVAYLKSTDPEWRAGGGGVHVTTNVATAAIAVSEADAKEQRDDLLTEIDTWRQQQALAAKSEVPFVGRFTGRIVFDGDAPTDLPNVAVLLADDRGVRVVLSEPMKAIEAPTPVEEVIYDAELVYGDDEPVMRAFGV
jgi:hypothetical protein